MADIQSNFKCPQCGEIIRIGRHYCPACGAKVDVQFDEIEKAVKYDKAEEAGEKIGAWARTGVTAMLFLGVVIFAVKDCYSPRYFPADANDNLTIYPPDVQSQVNFHAEPVPINDSDWGHRKPNQTAKGTGAFPFGYRFDATYRKDATEARGGDWKKVSQIITDGLSMLAAEQLADGSFPVRLYAAREKGQVKKWYNPDWEAKVTSGAQNDCTVVGATALAALCFLGDGDVDMPQNSGLASNKSVAGKAVKFLLSQQDPDSGSFGARNAKFCVNHAMATMAVIEYVGMTRDRDGWRDNAQKAVDCLVKLLRKDGGFSYKDDPAFPPNLEATAWALMALADAKEAGFTIPNEQNVINSCAGFLSSMRTLHGAVAMDPQQMAQAGNVRDWMGMYLTSVMILAGNDNGKPKEDVVAQFQKPTYDTVWPNPWKQSDAAAQAHESERGKELKPNDYFFATMALRYWGGKEWDIWQKAMIPVLLSWQDADTHAFRGNDDLSKVRGLVWSTSLNVLAAESYFRVP